MTIPDFADLVSQSCRNFFAHIHFICIKVAVGETHPGYVALSCLVKGAIQCFIMCYVFCFKNEKLAEIPIQ